MNIDKAVMIFAGHVILISLALGVWVNSWWLCLTAFAGVNMIQAGITGFCPVVFVMRKMGLPAGCAFQGRSAPEA